MKILVNGDVIVFLRIFGIPDWTLGRFSGPNLVYWGIYCKSYGANCRDFSLQVSRRILTSLVFAKWANCSYVLNRTIKVDSFKRLNRL